MLNDKSFETTDTDLSSIVFNGSMQKVLANHIGEQIIADFLVGTGNIATKNGILYDVGEKYMVIFMPQANAYVLGDIFNLKFATFPQNKSKNT